MDLNQHGAACRCLLRLRENEGEPGLSDAAFIARYLPRYPAWRERPGLADVATLFEVARDLGLAGGVDVFRDYDRVLQEHRAGRSIIVYAERIPEQMDAAPTAARYVMLLEAMTEETFTVWCPYPSGNAETLPAATRAWWDRWLAIGVVLYPA
jgi:hypothetical protein